MLQVGLHSRERRAKHRLPFQRQVRIDSSTVGQLQLTGVDYSPSGISVCSSQPLPVGEQLMLRFPVGRHRQAELEVAGEVVHACRQDNGYTILSGFAFWKDSIRLWAPCPESLLVLFPIPRRFTA
ncbi:PilZ domain-containing protein [Thiohalophilus sp.]|uniref:PilZ domain-containing protein n=1 Tax=Thiohalophilus sp. TaxID=3028392 RepID=UPI003A0FFD12